CARDCSGIYCYGYNSLDVW
nr:immunoglobulin heavy chain junction region [Macaca mulatta]